MFNAAAMLIAGGGGPPTIWNITDAGLNWSVTGGLTATHGAVSEQSAMRATRANTGKLYFEIKNTSIGSNVAAIGFANASCVLTAFPNDANGTSYRTGGNAYSNAGSAIFAGTGWADTTTTIGLAIDTANKRIAWAASNVWQGSANPAAGTGMYTYTMTGPIYPICAVQNFGSTTQSMLANFGASAFTYSPPSGYVAWDLGS